VSRNRPDPLALFEQVAGDVLSDIAEGASDYVHGVRTFAEWRFISMAME